MARQPHAVEIDLSAAPTADAIVEACRLGVVQALRHQELPLPWLWYSARKASPSPSLSAS